MSTKKPPKNTYSLQADWLRSFRSIHSLSQIELAKTLQISHQYLGSMEVGVHPISLPMMERLSHIYDVDKDQLLRIHTKDHYNEQRRKLGLNPINYKRVPDDPI